MRRVRANVTDRLGILVGSLLSAVFGYFALEARCCHATPSEHSVTRSAQRNT
jgi:Na+/H+ antiporter NhaA